MRTADGCVIGWPGRRNRDGYPISRIGKYQTVAQIMYELYIGRIPPGMCVRHTCDNRECVNPEHLIVGTQQDNIADAKARSRHRRGEQHPQTRYDDSQIHHVRTGKYSVTDVHALWGMSKSQYYRIKNKESRAEGGKGR